MTDLFDFIRNNFWHISPILIAGAFATGIIIERTRALFSVYPIRDMESFFDRMTELVTSGKVAEAISICDRYPNKPVAQVAKQALLRAHQPENLIESGLGIAVGKVSESIQKRTSFLATIANVATLLGLFGTIVGLIHSFQAIGHADPQQKSAILATGISQAMNATMLGLAVAIPCMVAFSFLINRTNKLVSEVDAAALRTFDIIKQRLYGMDTEVLSSLAQWDSDEDEATAEKSSAERTAPLKSRRRKSSLSTPSPERTV